jgi:hypothetical protein
MQVGNAFACRAEEHLHLRSDCCLIGSYFGLSSLSCCSRLL